MDNNERLINTDHKLTSNFIGEFFIDDLSICDDLIDFFHNSEHSKTEFKGRGITASGYDEKIKASTDLEIPLSLNDGVLVRYLKELQKCAHKYADRFPACDISSPWSIVEHYNIQHYAPGEGFYSFHYERGSSKLPMCNRHLVWMTYLNDVTDGGGTDFYHQEYTVNAEKGKTVIWPVDWTYTHRGQVSPTQEKYIITGWYSFYEKGSITT